MTYSSRNDTLISDNDVIGFQRNRHRTKKQILIHTILSLSFCSYGVFTIILITHFLHSLFLLFHSLLQFPIFNCLCPFFRNRYTNVPSVTPKPGWKNTFFSIESEKNKDHITNRDHQKHRQTETETKKKK